MNLNMGEMHLNAREMNLTTLEEDSNEENKEVRLEHTPRQENLI